MLSLCLVTYTHTRLFDNAFFCVSLIVVYFAMICCRWMSFYTLLIDQGFLALANFFLIFRLHFYVRRSVSFLTVFHARNAWPTALGWNFIRLEEGKQKRYVAFLRVWQSDQWESLLCERVEGSWICAIATLHNVGVIIFPSPPTTTLWMSYVPMFKL